MSEIESPSVKVWYNTHPNELGASKLGCQLIRSSVRGVSVGDASGGHAVTGERLVHGQNLVTAYTDPDTPPDPDAPPEIWNLIEGVVRESSAFSRGAPR